ncbi:MAG: Re/Si-specific NAD(P)(+) transhydrogenase subunit alpha [Planctomycetes bacterium]|nr:Re/Si-specific NAD(P)(+) transhydrogenase subunit alpha [Planctomycetota bacterium]
MILGVPRESLPGERRVALVPESVPKLAGLQVLVQAGAGEGAGAADAAYVEKGASIEPDGAALPAKSDVVARVRAPSIAEADGLREGAVLIALMAPHANLAVVKRLAERKVTSLALELVPRITRAQSMDVLSSMSSVAGYKAVLNAAAALPRFFPLLMTAAGTIPPAKVLVIGAGVAGLQAIATARRLGAVVEAYDTRPVVKEQVESLGAKFVELPLETKDAQDKGGYAKAQSEEFYAKQRELMGRHVAASDVVISTALIPGKRAPVLVTAEMVKSMRQGSVVVDLAAEAGGNCELTEPDRDVVKHGVTISGPMNLPATMAVHASQMFSRNVTALLLHLVKGGTLNLDVADEITRGALLTHAGEVMHEPTKQLLSQEAAK